MTTKPLSYPSYLRRLLALGGGVLLALAPLGAQQVKQQPTSQAQASQAPFQLQPLPYAEDALAPVISARTVALHYGKHLRAYATKLNQLVQSKQLAERDLVRLVSYAGGEVFDNAGQLLNHTLYFNQFKPYRAGATAQAQGALRQAILQQYGSWEDFKTAFETAGKSIFGSGWLWLATDSAGRLYIEKDQNAGSPVVRGRLPLIAVDVWEHAYYLDYENARAGYLERLWEIYDWERIGKRYDNRSQGIQLTEASGAPRLW